MNKIKIGLSDKEIQTLATASLANIASSLTEMKHSPNTAEGRAEILTIIVKSLSYSISRVVIENNHRISQQLSALLSDKK